MKVYGYEMDSEELIELQELSIQSNIEELDKLILFLQAVREEHGKVIGETEICHSHFRDWNKEWKNGTADLVIVTVSESK